MKDWLKANTRGRPRADVDRANRSWQRVVELAEKSGNHALIKGVHDGDRDAINKACDDIPY